MPKMSFTWTLEHHGWAHCAAADAQATVETLVSHVRAGPEEFLTAVARLVLGEAETRAEFEAEPTTYRWIFRQTHNEVRIQLLELADFRQPDEAGDEIWMSHQTID